MDTNLKIKALRAEMKSKNIDALIIGSADPHQSEYTPSYWSSREWISGFNGSAGTAIITHNHAGLWTDSRYFLQAEEQLSGSSMVLHKLKIQTQAEYLEWITQNLAKDSVVACDFWCVSMTQIAYIKSILEPSGLKFIDSNDLLSSIWLDRPQLPKTLIYEHELKYSGKIRSAKLNDVRIEMKKLNADIFLVSALDEIAYVLNLRGKDVHCNPVFVAYLCIAKNESILFIDPVKVSIELKKQLLQDKIKIQNYNELIPYLINNSTAKILVDPATLNARLSFSLTPGNIISSTSCIMQQKAIKNNVEIKHIRKVMERDGVALLRTMMWLENEHNNKKTPTEYELSRQLIHFRSKNSTYVNESFDAIVGYNSNGAIIHYRPDEKTSAKIKKSGILLFDSGGQYLDGTTDITRTFRLGPVSKEIKRQYTAVLLGHIALSKAIFPKNTKGVQLDTFARQFLWNLGLNYNHGTGHGVGFFMNVHEPPQGFVTAYNQRGSSEFSEGMLTSNEPGYYEEGSHGIRIENLILSTLHSDGVNGTYLSFESVTLFPYDASLIDSSMMDRSSIQWMNNYHQEVYTRLSKNLNNNEKKWLKEKCRKI
ncbi:MAG: aminopeptidase P family protein [Saprospiraceae bacterium]|nr:aminopeptidase P family protein [Saprospiraceae bacterium]